MRSLQSFGILLAMPCDCMAPSAIEVDHEDKGISTDPSLHIEHDTDDHVAFGTVQLLCLRYLSYV
jgi:hypothetical protein